MRGAGKSAFPPRRRGGLGFVPHYSIISVRDDEIVDRPPYRPLSSDPPRGRSPMHYWHAHFYSKIGVRSRHTTPASGRAPEACLKLEALRPEA